MKICRIALLLLVVRTAPSAQNASARVDGIVVESGTGSVLSKVTLNLHSIAGTAIQIPAITASDGRFLFRNVPPGRYTLGASRAGFLKTEFGQHGPNGAAVLFDVAAGQHVADLRISMLPSATISGQVIDREGEPVANAQIHAWKFAYPGGWGVAVPVVSQVSNDIGEYRLFGLPPGQYYVSAQPEPRIYIHSPAYASLAPPIPGAVLIGVGAGSIGGVPDPANASRTIGVDWSPIYFGGTADALAAIPIDLHSGSELRGMNIVIDRIPMVSITGTVVDGLTGQPVPTARVVATPMRSDSRFLSQVEISVISGTLSVSHPPPLVTSSRGDFRFGPLVRGTYLVTAILDDPQGSRRGGQAMVDLGATDVSGVKISVSAGQDIAGRVVIEGRRPGVADPNMAQLRVSLSSSIDPSNDVAPVTPSAVGAFTLHSVSLGDYLFNVMPLSNLPSSTVSGSAGGIPTGLKNAYVKSVRLGSIDILNDGLHLGDVPLGQIEVLIGNNPGTASGMVIDENRMGASGITVALLPDEAQRNRIDLYRSVITDASGRYRFDRVPPGSYKLFAWEDVEKNSWRNANFMKLYEDRGKSIVIGEGTEVAADLTSIGIR